MTAEYKYERDNLISIHFEDMVDMLSIIQDKSKIPKVNLKEYNELMTEVNGPDKYAVGARTVKELIEKSVVGNSILYNEHLVKMSSDLNSKLNIVDNLNVVPRVIRRKVRKEFGDEVDIHRVNQGKLDTAWTSTQRFEVEREHHLITLLIDIGGNWSVDAMAALWTGACALRFCEEVERAGKSIQIIVGGCATNVVASGKHMTTTCIVKKYNEHLTVERLAAMCHLGFYRSACFLCKMLSDERVVPGYGASSNLKTLVPIPLQDEIKMGKTKVVNITKSTNINMAIQNLKLAEDELLHNTKN